MKINVLELVNSLDIGGLEKVVLELINYQSEDNKFSLCCLESLGMLSDQIPENVEMIALNKDKKKYFLLVLQLVRFCIKHKIRIIHCHNYAPLLFAVLVKIFLLGKIKIVYTEHNQIYSISPKHLKIFKHLIKVADHLVFVSLDLQKYFLKNLIKKRAVTSYSVIWNGIKNPLYDNDECDRIYTDLNLNQDNIIIGTAVVMSKQKGLHNLIQAAPKIIADFPQVRFLMVGDGPLKEELEKQSKALRVADYFFFVGYKKQIGSYLKLMDLFILPSLWEGFSIVLLEASAIGLPIIATDVGGNSEIVIDQETGLVIKPSDPEAIVTACRKLIRNPDLRLNFSNNSRLHFQNNFLVDAMAEKYNNVFKQYV